jgi:hypothetical protein
MSSIYTNMEWLPKPPVDFSSRLERCFSLGELRELTKFSLEENQLRRICKKLHPYQLNRYRAYTFSNLRTVNPRAK